MKTSKEIVKPWFLNAAACKIVKVELSDRNYQQMVVSVSNHLVETRNWFLIHTRGGREYLVEGWKT